MTTNSSSPPAQSVPRDSIKCRKKEPISAMSMCEVQRIAALTNTYSPGSIDRRWQIAAAIALGSLTRRRTHTVIDADVGMAIGYLKRRQEIGAKFDGEFADIHRAWTLRYQADLLTRSIVEARLLGGQSIAETAIACSLPVGVVRTYESLFFAVGDKLKHRDYILREAVGPRYSSGYTEDDIDIVLKSLTYLKGPMFLDWILPYYTTPASIPDCLDLLSFAELARLHHRIEIRSLIHFLTLPPEDVLAAYARQAAGEPYTLWERLVAELQLLVAARPAREVEQKQIRTLSPQSIDRLMESYHTAPTPRGSCAGILEPEHVLVAG
jgi:hypothetical protein